MLSIKACALLIFHVPAVLRRSLVEMERRTDIKRLHVHGEKSAAYMADGYARVTGKPGVGLVVPGPGVQNASAALGTAHACSSPFARRS